MVSSRPLLMAETISSHSPAPTRTPTSPSSTISGAASMAVATTGVPQARASAITSPKGSSHWIGNSKKRVPASNAFLCGGPASPARGHRTRVVLASALLPRYGRAGQGIASVRSGIDQASGPSPYSPECVEQEFSEVRNESFKDHPFGVAPLLAILLHWVQPLPTGAWGKEYKRCISYRSNTESALSKWHRLLWKNTYESNLIHQIRITRCSSAQKGRKTYSQGQ